MPNSSPSTSPLQCLACGAVLDAGARRCWLCYTDVADAKTDANLPIQQLPAARGLDTQQSGTFSLTSVMLFVTLAAVVLGVVTIAPGIGIPLGVVSLVAWLRTAAVVHLRPRHGQSTSLVQHLQLFFASLGVTLGLIALSAAVAIATFTAGLVACQATFEHTDQIPAMIIVWCVVGLAIVVPACWWIRSIIRRRWRRDIGLP